MIFHACMLRYFCSSSHAYGLLTELHTDSIGRLIAERIKYKVPELNIVKIEGEQRRLKRLISRMTCVNPEERLSAANVFYVLHNLDSVDADLMV